MCVIDISSNLIYYMTEKGFLNVGVSEFQKLINQEIGVNNCYVWTDEKLPPIYIHSYLKDIKA